jgi:hypothetical protein
MKMNPSSIASNARTLDDSNESVRWFPLDRGTDEYRAMSNRAVAAISDRRPFPVAVLMICFTTWLIATEIVVFDQIKFNARVELLDQAARALRGPEDIAPTQRTLDFPSGGKTQKL